MLLNPIIQYENHSVLHWKQRKDWRESVFPMFHAAFSCKKHAAKHRKLIGKQMGNIYLMFYIIRQYINSYKVGIFYMFETCFLTLISHELCIEKHGNMYTIPEFTIKTCKTERKHRNEHG